MELIPPTKKTLAKYGFTQADWWALVAKQCSACPVCGRLFEGTCKPVIDHEHVKGWKKLKPEIRKLYVRGLLCNRCNWQFCRRGMTHEIAQGLEQYLYAYEKHRNQAHT